MTPLFELGPGPAVVAFDVGGTDIKSLAVGADGAVHEINRTPTPKHGDGSVDGILSHVGSLLERLTNDLGQKPDAVGLSVPGLVDEETGVGIFSANLHWRDAPIRRLAEERFALPVAFRHDVRSAGDAELRIGAARGYANVVTLAIGTGIAGSIVVDGRPYAAGGYAGELGHTLADPDGEPCACGAHGCLETIASAGAIARRYSERSGRTVTGAREVVDAARRGDDVAVAVWSDAVEALAEHIARLAAVLAPEAVVIGGGLAEADDDLFGPLAERINDLLSFHRRPILLKAALGEHAGVLGTALAARDLVLANGDTP